MERDWEREWELELELEWERVWRETREEGPRRAREVEKSCFETMKAVVAAALILCVEGVRADFPGGSEAYFGGES